MKFQPKRSWWKFWPVVCWKHLRIVARHSVCAVCYYESSAMKSLDDLMIGMRKEKLGEPAKIPQGDDVLSQTRLSSDCGRVANDPVPE